MSRGGDEQADRELFQGVTELAFTRGAVVAASKRGTSGLEAKRGNLTQLLSSLLHGILKP